MEDSVWRKKSAAIALRVNAALAELKMPKQELAARLGVSPQYVSRIVKGGENLTLETISKLEKALGISLSGGGDRSFHAWKLRAGLSPFLTWGNCEVNPRISVRKALAFEGNIPEEMDPAELKVFYQTKTSASIQANEVSVTAQLQYQYASRLCADIELTLLFKVKDLGGSLRLLEEGTPEWEEDLLENILSETGATVRGYAAAVLAPTALKEFPLPELGQRDYADFNGFKEIVP